MGNRTPQHIKNFVVRGFAKKRGLASKLSETEYAMPECFIVLNSLLGELEAYECIFLYSLFMRLRDPEQRETINKRSLETGKNLYAAVEEYRVVTAADVARVEDV